jgi:hypothetical protein
MAALVGMRPLVDFGTAGPVMMPWSTALFQCGSSSFAGEKAGWARWAPPRRARLVRCSATHSTALHMDAQEWSPWSGSVTAYAHKLWSCCGPSLSLGPLVLADRYGNEATRGRKRAGPPHGASCSVHVSLKLLASPDAAAVAAICN